MTAGAPIDDLSLDEKLADAMQKALHQTLNGTFSMQMRMGTWSVEGGPFSLDPYIICSIDMKQNEKSLGSFILGFSRDTIMKVLTQYGMQEEGSNPAVIDDAAAELTNIIYGAIKTAVNKTGAQLVMDIPTSVRDKKGIAEKFSKTEKMILPFWTDGTRCEAIVAKTSLH